MNYYIHDGEIYNQDELAHYGVVGMKWGVRKGNYTKAYKKATKKAGKLEKKYNKANAKAAKANAKMSKNSTFKSNKKLLKRMRKAHKLSAKAAKAELRGAKWTAKMEQTFKGVKISDIDKEVLDAGRKYMYMLEI